MCFVIIRKNIINNNANNKNNHINTKNNIAFLNNGLTQAKGKSMAMNMKPFEHKHTSMEGKKKSMEISIDRK